MGVGNFIADAGIALRSGQDENYEEAQRANALTAARLGIQRQQAANDLLPEETAARRAQLGLTTAQASTQTPLQQKKADVESTGLDVDQAKATNMQQSLPLLLGMQRDQWSTVANQARVGLAQSGIEVNKIPQMVKDAQISGAIDDQTANTRALAGFGYALASTDDPIQLDKTVQSYAQSAIDAGMLPNLKGAKVTNTHVQQGKDAAGNPSYNVQIDTDQGSVHLPGSAIAQAWKLINPLQLKEIGKGGKLVGIGAGGGVSELATNPEADRFDVKDGIYFDRQGKQSPTKLEGTSHDRLLINDGVQQLAQDFGAKMDPLSKMIDASTIKDPEGFAAARAELAARVGKGEEPMAAAKDLSDRYRKKQAAKEATGSTGDYTGPTPWKR